MENNEEIKAQEVITPDNEYEQKFEEVYDFKEGKENGEM